MVLNEREMVEEISRMDSDKKKILFGFINGINAQADVLLSVSDKADEKQQGKERGNGEKHTD